MFLPRVSKRLLPSLAPLCLLASVVPANAAAAPTAPAAPFQLLHKTTLPGEGGWDYLTLDSAARRLYMSRSSHVTVFNIDSNTVVGEVADLAGVHGVALDTAAGKGYTSNGRSNSVTVFDLKTFAKLSEISVDKGPDAILFDPASKRVFTFNGKAGDISAIECATGTVAGTVLLPGRPEFAVADGTGNIYVNIEDKSELAVVDAKSLKVEHIWPLTGGESPSGLALDNTHHRLFSVCDNQKLIVMNALTGDCLPPLTIGDGPDACLFDPATQLVFSPNGEDGTVSVYHEDAPGSFKAAGTFTTQSGARTAALDTKTHHLFTVSATPKPAEPGKRWRQYLPDTFTVLEYGAAPNS